MARQTLIPPLSEHQRYHRGTDTDTMSSDIVTSSCGDKRRTRSATKAILDFEGNLWLKLPKLGRKAMLGMMEGREVARLNIAMVRKGGRHALLEAYEKTEYRIDRQMRALRSCAARSRKEEKSVVPCSLFI